MDLNSFNFDSFSLSENNFNTVKGLKGQSAIEYLMTYGWMLLVVAIAGGAIFSITGDQTVESVNGFIGSDVQIDNLGTNTDGNLQMVLRNSASDEISVKRVRASGSEFTAEWNDERNIGISDTGVVTLNDVQETDGSNSLDVEIMYDIGNLENLTATGTVTGGYEVLSDSITYDLTADYSYSPSSPETGEAVTFTSESSPEEEISSYSWSSPDTSLDQNTGSSIQHVFMSEGSYTVNLTVDDGEGNQSSYTDTISVVNIEPANFDLSGVSDDRPVTEGETITFDYSLNNTGDVSGSQDVVLQVDGVEEDSETVSLNSGETRSSSLTWNTVEGDSGSYNYNIVTENDSVSGSINVESSTVSTSGAPSFSTAPSGAENEDSWVPVAPDSGTSQGFSYFFDETGDEEYFNVSEGFYVMKYEAKAYDTNSNSFVSSGNEGSTNAWAGTSIEPRSVAANKPWTEIRFNQDYGAVQACQALDQKTNEFDVHLVTNREWMTVARQIEQNNANWVGGSVDSSGQLIRGNSDGSDPYSASTDDSQGFYNLGSSEDSDYNERTFDLANGEVVWDWAGNVRQWVYSEDSGGKTTDGVFDSTVATDGSDDPVALQYEYDPAVVDRSTNGVGSEYDWNSGDAAVRGGTWDYGDYAGVFSAYSGFPGRSDSYYGFRCSAVPVS